MSIVTEDGTGLANAETYCGVADMRAYCDGRGLALTGLTDARIEQLLRNASDYLLVYSTSWQGDRLTATQALDWPRTGVYLNGYAQPPAPLPVALVNASALLAYKAKDGPLTPDVKSAAVKRLKLGPLEKEYDTVTPPGNSTVPRYPDVDRLLASLRTAVRAYQVPLRRS